MEVEALERRVELQRPRTAVPGAPKLLDGLRAEPRTRHCIRQQPPVRRRSGRRDELVAFAISHREKGLCRRDQGDVDAEPVHRLDERDRRELDVPVRTDRHVTVDDGHAGTAERNDAAASRKASEALVRDQREVVEREAFGAWRRRVARRRPPCFGRRPVDRCGRRTPARYRAQALKALDELVAAELSATEQ